MILWLLQGREVEYKVSQLARLLSYSLSVHAVTILNFGGVWLTQQGPASPHSLAVARHLVQDWVTPHICSVQCRSCLISPAGVLQPPHPPALAARPVPAVHHQPHRRHRGGVQWAGQPGPRPRPRPAPAGGGPGDGLAEGGARGWRGGGAGPGGAQGPCARHLACSLPAALVSTILGSS